MVIFASNLSEIGFLKVYEIKKWRLVGLLGIQYITVDQFNSISCISCSAHDNSNQGGQAKRYIGKERGGVKRGDQEGEIHPVTSQCVMESLSSWLNKLHDYTNTQTVLPLKDIATSVYLPPTLTHTFIHTNINVKQ